SGSIPGGPVCVAPVLEVRGRVRDAAGLGAQARTDNLSGRIHRRPESTTLRASEGAPATVRALVSAPSTVLLIDDVVTTGATAGACVAALREGGLGVDGVLCVTSACGPHTAGPERREAARHGRRQDASGRLLGDWTPTPR